MRTLTEIIVHCSATRPEWMDGQPTTAKVAEIKRWHVQGNGWSDIGYHFLIDRDGAIVTGRPIERDGAHVRGHNRGTVGICLIGGFGSSENDDAFEHFTPPQMAALRVLIGKLQNDHRTITKVSGHNEYAAKACPGFRVPLWFKDKPARKSPVQTSTIKAAATTAVAGAGGVASVLGALTPAGQIIVLACAAVCFLSLGWIARERIKRWARGDR